MKRLIIAIMLPLVGLASWSFSPTDQETVLRNQLVEVLQAVNDRAMVSEKENIRFDYSHKIVYNPYRKMPSTVMNVSVLQSKESVVYHSSQFDYFQDAKEAFVVLHDQNVIYQLGSAKRNDWEASVKMLSELKEFLVKESTILSNQTITEDGKKWKEVVFAMPETLQRSHRIARLAFVFDTTTKTLKRTKVTYDSSSEVSWMEVEIKELSKSRHVEVKSPVRSYVLNSTGNLKRAYQGYELIKAEN